jgi:plastocyanin
MKTLVMASGIVFFLAANAARAEEAVIHVANFTYDPAELIIKPGTTVTWVNDDDIPHLIAEDNGKFRSKALDTGEKFSMILSQGGEIDYYCALHPHMKGKILVKS